MPEIAAVDPMVVGIPGAGLGVSAQVDDRAHMGSCARTPLAGGCRRALLAVLTALAMLLVAGSSARAQRDLGTVALDQPSYTAHESQRELAITIVRSNPRGEEQVGYGVHRSDAVPGEDFDTVTNHYIRMADGQRTFAFTVHIHDNGMNAPPVHAVAYLYGAWPQRAVNPHQAQLTILRDDPIQPRPPVNPLGVAVPATDGNPLSGARFYVLGAASPAGQAAAALRGSKPRWASALDVLAGAPSTRRFWFWNEPDPRSLVARWLEGTQYAQPGSTAQISTYSLVHGGCGATATRSFTPRYRNWIDKLAQGIGNFRVVVYLEVDSLITAPCLSPGQLHTRLVDQLGWAVSRLARDPHVVLYLDGGAADAVPWQTTARWLQMAGVRAAQGFFLNATHFDWTSRELYYGQRIARRLGGVHFVVDTHGGGRGPLVPADRVHDGNEVLCNPAGRGLGPLSTHTGYRWADAFVWGTATVGNSGGSCRPGAPADSVFWPEYAVMLVRNAVSGVTGPRYPLVREP